MFGRVASRSLVALLAALLVIPVVPATPVAAAGVDTTTTTTSSDRTSTYGEAITFTATVETAPPGGGTPTGAVQFRIDGVDVGLPAALVNGEVTSTSINDLAVGTYAVTAHYTSNDSEAFADSDGTLTGDQVVGAAKLTVTPDPQSVAYGSPEPEYTFDVDGFVMGEHPGSAADYADPTCDSDYTNTTSVASSPRPITCSGGNATNYVFSYGTSSLTIEQATQTIQFTSSPPTATTVSGPTYTPAATATSGLTVVFTIDGASSGVCVISAGGVVSFTGTGTCTVTASQPGDTNWNPAPQVQQSFGVVVGTTTTTLGSSANPVTYGTGITLTATVSPSAATGTVTFKNGPTTLGSCTLAAGTCGHSTGTRTLGAGSHPITAEYSGDSTYAGSPSTVLSQTVNHKVLTVTGITASNKTYDGTTGATLIMGSAALSGVVPGDTVTPVISGATGAFADKNVGNGKTVQVAGLALGGADAANYTLTQPATTANITPRSLTVTATGINKVYDRTTAATVALASAQLVDGDGVTLSYSSATFSPNANVGTKTVNVTGIAKAGADAGNYTLLNTTATTIASITPRPLAMTVIASDKTYDGTTAATATGLLDDVITGDRVNAQVGGATFADKNVGTDKVVSAIDLDIGGPESSQYVLLNTTAATTANITPRSLTVTATGVNKVYDGTTTATVSLGDNRIAGDVLTTTYAAAAFASAGVGTGKAVSVTGISITGGADAGNYTLGNTTAATTANITAASVTAAITAIDKAYDGTTTAAGTTCTVTGALGADAANLTCSGTAVFADENVGTNKAVTMTGITLGGTAAGNYTLGNTTAATTANITPRSLTVTATGVNKVYDGTTTATVNLASNKLAADTVNLAYTGAAFLDKTVGTGKLVDVSGISISGGADAGNYTLANTTEETAANISRRTLAVTASGGGKVYDGTTAASITLGDDRLAGDTLTVGFTSATFATEHAGAGKTVTVAGLFLGGPDAGNYQLAGTTTTVLATISRRPITVTAVTSTKVYDGTTSATGTPTITVGTLAVGDTGTWTQAYTTKTAGVNKPIQPAGAVADGNSGNNYDVTFANNTTGAITQKPLTVSGITAANKVYDGTTAATLVGLGGATLVGRVGADVVTLSIAAASGTFADKNVGAAKAVAVAGLSISGTDAANYTLTQPTATASITKAPLAVAADPKSRPYGSANPALTVTYSGFVGGETLATSGVTGSANCTTPATTNSSFGDYEIECGGSTLTAGNYAIPIVGGSTFTVTRAELTLTADPATRQYGDADRALTGTVTGFVLGQTAASAGLSGSPVCETSVLATANVGKYIDAVTCAAGTLGALNYDVTILVPGTLTITPALAAPTVSSSVNPAPASANVTFTASVSWPVGAPSGTVTFYEGAVDLSGPVTLVGGSASFTTSYPTAGTHDIVAVYSGDGANFGEASSVAFAQAVGKADVGVVVTADRSTWETNVPITFTADVASLASGVTLPITGAVAFRIDGALKATVPVAGGKASYTTKLALGGHLIVAAFTPDVAAESVFKPGTSAPFTKTVVANTVSASGVGVSSSSVYPVKDTWKDTVAIRGTRNEPASVAIKIYRVVAGKDPVVRKASLARASGAYAYNWNGRNSSGRVLPAGKYKVVQVVADAFGAKKTYTSTVTLSTKKMTWYTKTITVSPGPRNYQMHSTLDTSILSAPSTSSTSPLVMSNATSTPAWIAAGYQFTLPSASTYTSLSFQVKGSWTDAVDPKAPPKIGLIPWNGGDWGSIYSKTRARSVLGTSSTTWYTQSITNLSGIRSGRSVRAAVDTFYVDGASDSGHATGPFRYSITGVRLVVKYGILK